MLRSSIAIFAFSLICAVNVHATQKVITATVDRIITDTKFYGGCMVLAPTEEPLSAYGLNCRNNYFTFDCRNDADLPGGRLQAELNLQQAQLALALNASIQLTVTDAITINGNCYASRVVVIAPEQ